MTEKEKQISGRDHNDIQLHIAGEYHIGMSGKNTYITGEIQKGAFGLLFVSLVISTRLAVANYNRITITKRQRQFLKNKTGGMKVGKSQEV